MLTVRDICAVFSPIISDTKILLLLDKCNEVGIMNAPELDDEEFRKMFVMSFEQLTKPGGKNYDIPRSSIQKLTKLYFVYYLIGNIGYMEKYLDVYNLEQVLNKFPYISFTDSYIISRMVKERYPFDKVKEKIIKNYLNALIVVGDEDRVIEGLKYVSEDDIFSHDSSLDHTSILFYTINYARKKVYDYLNKTGKYIFDWSLRLFMNNGKSTVGDNYFASKEGIDMLFDTFEDCEDCRYMSSHVKNYLRGLLNTESYPKALMAVRLYQFFYNIDEVTDKEKSYILSVISDQV